MMAKHILVPTDFSDHADQALAYAIELAKTLQAHLTLLHVIHLTLWTMSDMVPSTLEAYLQEMETEAQQRMQVLLDRLHQEGLEGETSIIQGIPF